MHCSLPSKKGTQIFHSSQAALAKLHMLSSLFADFESAAVLDAAGDLSDSGCFRDPMVGVSGMLMGNEQRQAFQSFTVCNLL